MAVELRTERLLRRPWRDSDRAPFAAMNSDPETMRPRRRHVLYRLGAGQWRAADA